MENGEHEFDQMLKGMEAEILALKTAHQRPLGALDFFKKNLEFNITLNLELGSYYRKFKVIVKIAEPTAKPPILQPSYDTPSGFPLLFIDGSNVNSSYTEYEYDFYLVSATESSATIKFGALSSQPIESITWSYL